MWARIITRYTIIIRKCEEAWLRCLLKEQRYDKLLKDSRNFSNEWNKCICGIIDLLEYLKKYYENALWLIMMGVV